MRTLFQDRLDGDTQEGSYHGHRIDVLLTKQGLKKQHCTLGKRESQRGGSGETEHVHGWVGGDA